MADWFELGGGTPSLQKVIAVAHIVDTTVAAPEFQGGISAWGSGTSSTQIGVSASAGGANAIVIGDGASAPGDAGIAIGVNAAAGDDATDTDTIAIGHNVSLTGNAIDAIAIGSDITANGMLRGIIIGDSVTITNQAGDSVNIGQGINVAYNSSGVLIGKGITSTQVLDQCIGIGYGVTFTSATISGGVAIGYGAVIDGGNNHVAIGTGAQCYGGINSVAIGISSKAGRSGVTATSTVAIGSLAVYGSYNSTGYGISIGDNCIIYGDYNVGVGRGVNIAKNAGNTGSSAAFFGGQANQCTVIGAGSIINQASHRGTIVGYTSKIGVQDTSKAQDGIILGSNCQIAANHDNAILIGNDLTSSSAEDFCLGESSALYRFLGTFPDNNTLLFGTGKDASIFYDGTNLTINPKVVGSGYLTLNGGNLVCNSIHLGGDTPTGLAYVEAQSLTSSTYVALVYGQLEYTGSGALIGSFQTTMTNNSSSATPQSYGSAFQAWSKQTSPTLAYNYGSYIETGFFGVTEVQSSGINVFTGAYLQVLGSGHIGGTHSGGTVYASGLIIPTILTPVGVATFKKWGIKSQESIEVYPDAKIAFDSSGTNNGNSYLVYDSGSSSLDCYVDAAQVFDCTSSLLTLFPAATFVHSIDATTGKIGLAGTSATGTSLINANFSGSLRGCLAFVYEATGGTIAANINNDITVSADMATGYAGLNAMTVNYDGAGTNNFYAQKADFGLKSTLVLTQGTQNIYGLYCDHSKGTGNASSSGGTVNLYGIYVGAMSAMSGSITTAKWAAMFDDDVQINTNDKLILGGSTGTKEDNEIYWDGTDIVVTHAGSTKAKVTSGGLSIEGTNELVSGSRCYIQFGDGTAGAADRYLKGAHNGVVMTSTKGITMPRAGSITAVSYNLGCTIASAASTADIEVRINGSNVFSITGISTASTGVRSGQSTQARGTDTFAAGDILGAYYNSSTAVATVDDIFVLIEVTFDS